MIIEKFSLKVLDAVDRAGRLAVKHGHRHTTEWHLFAAMLQQDDTHLKQLLSSAEVDLDVLSHKIDTRLIGLPRAGASDHTTPVSRTLERVFVNAEEHASADAEKYIRINHLMLGLLDDADLRSMIDEIGGRRRDLIRTLREPRTGSDATPPAAARGNNGTSAAPAASANDAVAAHGATPAPTPAAAPAAIESEALAKYARDLTAAARAGELDPLIGRDAEVQLAIEILSRRRK
ncbi:MAG TPA: Clp protease N-terminal domain-containing protein, partial [Kofleriaceae bacterium]